MPTLGDPSNISGVDDDRLCRIESVTDAALAHLDVEDLLAGPLERVCELLAVDTATVLLLDSSSQQLVATAARGIEAVVRQGIRIPMGKGFAGRIAAEKQPVFIEPVDHTNVLNPILVKHGIRSLLGVPLLSSETVIGVLHVGTFDARRFTGDEVSQLQNEAPEKVKIFVGGLPQQPEPPLNYQIVYSLEGALDYYTTPSWVLRGGKPTQVDALSELELVEFPSPVGTLEAFHTGGGISTLPFAYNGKIETMEYKTLRYPGHVAIMRPIRELGLLSNEPIEVKGHKVAPRDLFIAAVHPRLHKPAGRDLVALQVQVTGQTGGKPARVSFRLIDYYDAMHGISAMMRTTGYSLSITGQMQVDGRVTAKGVHTPDEAVPFQPYVSELAKRGIEIEEI